MFYNNADAAIHESCTHLGMFRWHISVMIKMCLNINFALWKNMKLSPVNIRLRLDRISQFESSFFEFQALPQTYSIQIIQTL